MANFTQAELNEAADLFYDDPDTETFMRKQLPVIMTKADTVASGSVPVAADVNITDAGEFFDTDNVEGVLQEVGGQFVKLSSTDNGEGASLIGVEDAADLFTNTTVEGVLAEIYNASQKMVQFNLVGLLSGSTNVFQFPNFSTITFVAVEVTASGSSGVKFDIGTTNNSDGLLVQVPGDSTDFYSIYPSLDNSNTYYESCYGGADIVQFVPGSSADDRGLFTAIVAGVSASNYLTITGTANDLDFEATLTLVYMG